MQERLGVDDRRSVNIDKYGNTTGGTIPLACRDAVDRAAFARRFVFLLARSVPAIPPAGC